MSVHKQIMRVPNRRLTYSLLFCSLHRGFVSLGTVHKTPLYHARFYLKKSFSRKETAPVVFVRIEANATLFDSATYGWKIFSMNYDESRNGEQRILTEGSQSVSDTNLLRDKTVIVGNAITFAHGKFYACTCLTLRKGGLSLRLWQVCLRAFVFCVSKDIHQGGALYEKLENELTLYGQERLLPCFIRKAAYAN